MKGEQVPNSDNTTNNKTHRNNISQRKGHSLNLLLLT